MYYTFVLLNLITLGLLVGGLCFANMAIVPTFSKISTEQYAEFHHILDSYSDPYMPILTFSTVLFGTGELWFPQPGWQIISRLIGVICVASVAVISIVVHGPLNRRIRTWEPGVKIEHLAEMRFHWAQGHRLRTIIAFVGLLAFLLPVVFPF